MAYPSPDAVRRDGGLTRKLLIGGAFGAVTLSGAVIASPYVDLTGLARTFGIPTHSASAPGQASSRQAAAEDGLRKERLSLFDPHPTLSDAGVRSGFAPREGARAQVAMVDRSVVGGLRMKPTPLPEEAADGDATPQELANPFDDADAPEAMADASDAIDMSVAPLPSARPPELALLAPEDEDVEDAVAPRPPRRPEGLTTSEPRPRMTAEPAQSRPARRARSRAVVARNETQEPSFFQKLFGGLSQGPDTALSYAPTGSISDDPGRMTSNPSRATSSRGVAPRVAGGQAIYDISAGMVYMPDGSRLEAHSGLGSMRDNPRYAHVRMKGVTPPHVYNLREREALFHGVRAIRLLPVRGSGAIYNRDGLLAHTYMLGPNGDSNGCVSIRNYRAFLNAFLNGEIKQLVVVDTMRNLDRVLAMR